ncbi:hypothetical protein BH10BAC4_BH10BAC4_09050 [soil metagenome]
MHYRSAFFLTLFCFLCSSVFSQKIELINSKEVVDRGKILYDSGQYDAAIKEYLKVQPNDTNYVYMLSELALSYNASKNYKKSEETSSKGIEQPSEYKAHFLRTMAISQDLGGEYEKSILTFKNASKEFPFDYSLKYNLGITYYNHKEYELAAEYFQKTLSINPFHAGSYLNWGKLLAFQGRKTEALFALGMYLGISNGDNTTLVFLERLCNNEIAEEGSITASSPNPFARLDQILRAKIAMDEKFKTQIPINASLVKQYQMISDQLAATSDQTNDFWVKFFVPLFLDMKAKDLYEPFIYHILSSSKIEQVPKWKNKNQKRLDAFFSLANARMNDIRKNIVPPEEMGFGTTISAWYNKQHKLEALGVEDEKEVRSGPWMFFSSNGQMTAKGLYNKTGKKTGVWEYRRENGIIKNIENEDTGLIERFDEQGAPFQRYYLKNEQVDGSVEIYYPCGLLKEKLAYHDGKREGEGVLYFVDGTVQTTYKYKNDLFDGESQSFHENGKRKSISNYSMDKLEGVYTEFYADGKVKIKGAYLHGEANGPWFYYHSNGKLEKTGQFNAEGYSHGEWKFYGRDGRLEESRFLTERGEIDGENKTFHKNKLHHIITYVKGIPVQYTYFDETGKEFSKSGSKDGTYVLKGFYPTGQLHFEGAYKQGKMTGLWKYFFITGNKSSEFNYTDGERNGAGYEYFKTGQKKVDASYKEGKLDGYYQEFYQNGKLKEEGWFKDDLREQQWVKYYSSGVREGDVYYLRNAVVGIANDFNPDGKKYFVTTYLNDKISKISYFNSAGEITISQEYKKKNESFSVNYKNGNPRMNFEITCGEYTGSIVRTLPQKQLSSIIPMKNGKRDGKYILNFLNGNKEGEGQYLNGSEDGHWIWLHYNGQKHSEGLYNNGERDSIWTFWSDNGKVSRVANYKAGKRDGLSQDFRDEGVLLLEKNFDDGEIITYRTTTIDGSLGEWKSFNGNESIVSYFANGRKASEESYKNGMLEGFTREYFPSGQLSVESYFKAGEFSGDHLSYYPSGKIKMRATYLSGEYNGLVSYYLENGKLEREENYSNGILNGNTTLYSNGIKAKEYNFWYGIIEE